MKSPRKKKKPPASEAAETPSPPPAPATAAPQPVPEPRAAAESSTPEQPSAGTEAQLKIPPLLLEGDAPSSPPRSGRGQRYALGQGAAEPSHETPEESTELPEAYGTQKLH